LIREQFDINDFERIRKKSRKITNLTLKKNIYTLLVKAGLRKINHSHTLAGRHKIPMSHGFKKFWMNQAVRSKIKPEAREMLLAQKIGLASAYYRPSEEVFGSYLIVVDNLTISSENRLRREIETLGVEKSLMDQMRLQIEQIQAQINADKSM
jgi:hypothetical protein